MKKRFSLKNKLMIVFGLLILVACLTLGILAVRTARKAVTEKVEAHLIDKATDTAEIIDGRINAFFQFLEGLTRSPQIRDSAVSFQEKTSYLIKEAKANPIFRELYIVDTKGIQQNSDGSIEDYKTDVWFIETMKGKKYTAEPYHDKTRNNQMFITFSLPIYDDNKNIVGVLGADVDGLWLSDQIKDIVVGSSGYMFILGATGTNIAHKNTALVEERRNVIEKSNTDTSLASPAAFEKIAMRHNTSSVGFYDYKGETKIASYAHMNTTGWTIIITAPKHEFMGTINALRSSLLGIGALILLIALVIVFFVAQAMVKPIGVTVEALKNIAQGGRRRPYRASSDTRQRRNNGFIKLL